VSIGKHPTTKGGCQHHRAFGREHDFGWFQDLVGPLAAAGGTVQMIISLLIGFGSGAKDVDLALQEVSYFVRVHWLEVHAGTVP